MVFIFPNFKLEFAGSACFQAFRAEVNTRFEISNLSFVPLEADSKTQNQYTNYGYELTLQTSHIPYFKFEPTTRNQKLKIRTPKPQSHGKNQTQQLYGFDR